MREIIGMNLLYNVDMQKNELRDCLKSCGINITDEQLKQLDTYADMLISYNEKINLTAITEKDQIYEKHFYDSLLLSFARTMEGCLVDVGTGAGFPGVVLKIVYPDLKVILLEPLNKRCIFLNELIKTLGLKDIEVINSRGEDYALSHREEYDMVTARAVTNLNALIEIAGAMVKVGGIFFALRGLNGNKEIIDAEKAYTKMGFVLKEKREFTLSDGSLRIIADLEKIKETPLKFPRNYSMIKRKPL